MAGQPKRRRMIAELEKRTREEMDPGATHLDYAVRWVASGGTLVDLANSIAKSLDPRGFKLGTFKIFRGALSDYLDAVFGEDNAQRCLDRARARGAHGLVENAQVIADEQDGLLPGAATAARLKMDSRHYLAERWNKADFAQAKGTNVTISMATLHLDALRRMPPRPAAALPAAIVEDAEVLSIEAPTTSTSDE
jgi:hypothetical protein